jgi:predicted anti-sigma-YlaC factor YlaD
MTTGHEELEQLLPDFVRGDVSADVFARVSSHVDNCPSCQGWLKTYHLLIDLASERVSDHPEADVIARLALDPPSLPPAQRESGARHLAHCPRCREETRACRSASTRVADLPTIKVPDKRIGVAVSASRRRPSAKIAIALAASLIVAVVAGSAILTRLRADQPAQVSLAGSTLTGSQIIEAAEVIDATRTRIDDSADVTLKAQRIEFGEGFAVSSSARLTIESSVE